MKFRLWLSFVIVLSFPILAFAQKNALSDDAANEKQRRLAAIVEQTLADIQNLRLPENRALFYSQTGNLIWLQDKERAVTLFQSAAAELIAAQNAAESKRSSNPDNELLTGGSTRQQILDIIAARDAEMALDMLVKTRPSAVQRALFSETQENTKIGIYQRGNNYLTQNELRMEQNFYRMAADQSPERAVKILKESLSKGLSNDTFGQLGRLAEKDAAVAAEMASRVVDKLMHASYMIDGQPHYINIQLTQSVLNHHISGRSGSDRKLKFDDAQIRELVAKFISSYLSDQRTATSVGPWIVGVAEKLMPSALDPIKKVNSRLFPQNAQSDLDTAYQRLLASDTPPDQMLAAANKFPTDTRRQILHTASNKLMGQGNTGAARAALAENFADEAREQVLRDFDNQHASNLISQGKFVEAEGVIDGLPDQYKVPALVNLATTAFARDRKENRTYATALLAKASQLTTEKPESSVEMNLLFQVITGYGNLDPAEAIRIFEGLVPKINELTDAAAILNGFQNGSSVRAGEFIMVNGDPFQGYGADASMIGSFGKFDFDRTMKLIDSFTRHEMRIWLRLQLATNSDLSMVISSLPIRGRSLVMVNRQ